MTGDRVLYLLGSAAPPVLSYAEVVADAQARGWDVVVGLTPTAAAWLEPELPGLAELTGHPVKCRFRWPGEPEVLPPADAVLVAPATLNTVNSIALGLTPSWVAAFAAEAIGRRIPMAVMPCTNQALTAHPQMARSVETLREAGVRVLLGEGGFVPNPPGTGNPAMYPWEAALDAMRHG
ncbi:flavoprotein [Kitasatospora sp. NPDC054939]